jgi:hypothetical protein
VTGRNHYDRAIALYNPAEHRALASRFGQDVGVVILSLRSWVLWLLGYPEAAQQDTKHALANAREVGQATTLMYALWAVGWTHKTTQKQNPLAMNASRFRIRRALCSGSCAECCIKATS